MPIKIRTNTIIHATNSNSKLLSSLTDIGWLYFTVVILQNLGVVILQHKYIYTSPHKLLKNLHSVLMQSDIKFIR